MSSDRVSTCLWFDNKAKEAATFYVSVFNNSRILKVAHYGKEGFEVHGRPAGSVMTVQFELDGRPFLAVNGGPHFAFTPAISLIVTCDSQAEIDTYWAKLSAHPDAEQCGWLKDRYGLSWQIVPRRMEAFMTSGATKSDAVMNAMLKMKKIDIAGLEAAYAGA